MRFFLYFFFLLLSPTVLVSGQTLHHELIAIDTCENYLVLDGSTAPEVSLPGTFIFLLQVKGAVMDQNNDENFGSLVNLNGVGRYELNRILAVSGDTIFPEFKLRHDYQVTPGATLVALAAPIVDGQLINSQVATPYADGPGGILLIGSDLPLNISADLTAEGAGYQGGEASIRDSQCGAFTNANDYFYDQSNWRGAYKGESPVYNNQLLGRETGRGPNLSAGGGGNDHNSGGGGGANVSTGGDGAINDEPGFFNCKGNFPGQGGRALPTIDNGSQRIYLGGGGGAGHGNNPNPTAGGNGGGIIVISAPSITFSGNPTLSVRGADAQLVDGDGGGAGGAGGSMLLFSQNTEGVATLDLTGGIGADVENNNQNRCFGPGGGGAGGRLLHNGLSTANWLLNLTGGSGGESLNSQACAPGENVADNGNNGLLESSLQLPMTIQEVLSYPELTILPGLYCPGQSLEIGFPNDGSCYASEWFIATPNAFISLLDNPDYTGNNTTVLSTADLPPAPPSGLPLTYLLQRYDLTGRVVASALFELTVGEQPVADFTVTTDELSLELTNNSSLADSYLWTFGDGNSSTLETPTHTYDVGGTYTITLVVTNACGSDTTTLMIQLESVQPIAAFSFSSMSACVGDTIKLWSNSQNSSSINWSSATLSFFPNNSADTVYVTANQPGLELFTLCASNGGLDSCVSGQLAFPAPPAYTLTTSTNGNTFTGSAFGEWGLDLYWILPSGDTLFGTDISTTFPGPGTYEITFVATNGACPDYVETFIIEILAPTFPRIDLTLAQGCAPHTVRFINATSGPTDSIRWTFVEAMPTSSSNDTVLVTYPEPGTFQAILTVYSPNGTFSDSSFIEVLPAPIANFTVAENGGLLTTTNLSTGANSYQWNFGDGNGSTEFEPTHQYDTTGTFEVTLNAFNVFCSRALGATVFVDMVSAVGELSNAKINLYPNPTTGWLLLDSPAGQYQLFTLEGKAITGLETKPAGVSSFSLSDFPAGAYLLHFSNEDGQQTFRILKD